MAKAKRESRTTAKRGRVCAMCHQRKGWWEFSGGRDICCDCQKTAEPQGLDSLMTFSRKHDEQHVD